MTVRELIEELQKLPEEKEDLPVFCYYIETGDIDEIREIDDSISDRVDLNTY